MEPRRPEWLFTCDLTTSFLILCLCLPVMYVSIVQWDEALLTMSKGETAKIEIEAEWAYGKKGQPDSKYPLQSCKSPRDLEKYQTSRLTNWPVAFDHGSFTQSGIVTVGPYNVPAVTK